MKIIFFFLLMAKSPLKVEIIFTSNINGNFGKSKATWINPDFPPVLGGFESLYELVKNERELAEKNDLLLLLFDTGNFTGGFITGDNLKPDSIVFLMNILKYDAINLGVKELILFPVTARNFSFLPQTMRLSEYLSKFNTTFISSNLQIDDKSYTDLVKPYKIVNYKGVKIGIFGLISENTPFFMYQDAYISPGSSNIKIYKEYEIAKKMVEKLKSEGCDIIIMLSSIGYYRERFIARDVPGIDLILGGFDGFGERTAYIDPVNHTIVLRNYDYLSQIGKIILYVDPLSKTIVNFNYIPVTPFEEEFTPLAPIEETEDQE
ncbi:MAG: hypothetical protein ABIL92_04260 [candidate division WOR-3 bacterium]